MKCSTVADWVFRTTTKILVFLLELSSNMSVILWYWFFRLLDFWMLLSFLPGSKNLSSTVILCYLSGMWSLSLSVWSDNSVGLQRELAKCWASFLCRCVDKKKVCSCVPAFIRHFRWSGWSYSCASRDQACSLIMRTQLFLPHCFHRRWTDTAGLAEFRFWAWGLPYLGLYFYGFYFSLPVQALHQLVLTF